MKKAVHYVNQFYGQLGAEEFTNMQPSLYESTVPVGREINKHLGMDVVIQWTMIAGDNYMAENLEEGVDRAIKLLQDIDFDILIAGPAFFAGRYGMACGALCEAVINRLHKKAVTSMYPENPGVDAYKSKVFIAPSGKSAAKMRDAIQDLAKLVKEVGSGVLKPGCAYISQGRRVNVHNGVKGAVRAFNMLERKLNGAEYTSEVPLPEFKVVKPAPAVKDLRTATIALLSTGGLIPLGNPDKMPSGNSQKWAVLDFGNLDNLRDGKWDVIHGGYDNKDIINDPDRLVPLDAMRILEKEGEIGRVLNEHLYTVGNVTPVAKGEMFGREMAQMLLKKGVQAAILSST